jgi:RNA-dependent RNA polymerase
MVLEDRGVTLDAFTDLQEVAVKEARTINDSIERFSGVLVSHNLGTEFRLAQTLRALEKLGFDLQHSNDQEAINNQFIVNLQHFAMNHILRDIKHKSRILIPESWLLVGVADEGPAYEGKPGYENVYSLPEGKIYGKLTEILNDGLPTYRLSISLCSKTW